MRKKNKIDTYAKAVVLIVFIGVLVLLNIITPNRSFSESENRMLQQAPKFSFKHLLDGRFTSKFEKYVTDQFPLRDFFIGVKSNAEKALGKKENNGVYLGEDGYLMEKFNAPKDEEIKEKIDVINQFHSLTPNLKTYLAIIPNSLKILEDKLPSYAPTDDELSYINKVKNYVHKDIQFENVYDTLYSKKDEYIYYKTDHHWTTKGAYYAYENLISDMGFSPYKQEDFNVNRLSDNFYGSLYSKGGFRDIGSDSIELYTPKVKNQVNIEYCGEDEESDSFYYMENIDKKDKYSVFFNGNHPLMKINSQADNNESLLVIKDSYANCLLPFLSLHYKDIYVVDLRYYNEDLKELIENNNIKNMLYLYNVKTFSEDVSIEKQLAS